MTRPSVLGATKMHLAVWTGNSLPKGDAHWARFTARRCMRWTNRARIAASYAGEAPTQSRLSFRRGANSYSDINLEVPPNVNCLMCLSAHSRCWLRRLLLSAFVVFFVSHFTSPRIVEPVTTTKPRYSTTRRRSVNNPGKFHVGFFEITNLLT